MSKLHTFEEDREEGEVRVYDEEAYIVSDGEMFQFQRRNDIEVNWRAIRHFDNLHQEQLNLLQSMERQTGLPQESKEDVSSHILQNLDAIAFCNFESDRNGKWLSKEGHQALKIMQYTMQYYMFAQKHLTDKVLTLNNYLTTQNAELEKLTKFNNLQKHKLNKQKHISKKINEQAIHYELILQKMRPDLLENRMKAMKERKDIRLVDPDDEREVVKNILKEQNVIKEGQETIIYDKVAYRDKTAEKPQEIQNDKMEQILNEIKNLKSSLSKIQQMPTREVSPQPKPQPQSQPQQPQQPQQPYQQQLSMSKKFSSPSREKKPDPVVAPVDKIEESIKSDQPPVQIQAPQVEASSKNLEDSSSSVGPKMRRVKNPYGTSDLSASVKSSQSIDGKKFGSESLGTSSQNLKSKRKIEIEKLSDAGEDSYLDDDFEDTINISQSHEKTLLQKQLQQKQLQQLQQQKQQQHIQRSVKKGKKDATPIKEEDIEDDTSAYDEDARKKTLKKNDNSIDQLFDRDDREDDELEKDLLKIERDSKISRSQTNSIPIEDPSLSGSFVPSQIEKARNVNDHSQTIQSTSNERNSILSPTALQKAEKNPFTKEKKPESDDEYVDDDFDIEDEEEEIVPKQEKKKDIEVDFAISASASLLPPLAGQKMDNYQSNTSAFSRGKADLKPEHFALNLADSNPSLDFDISGSRGFGGSGHEYGLNLQQRSRRGTEKYGSKEFLPGGLEKSGSMDSHDFGLSESNFSMSRPGTSQYEKRQNLHVNRQRGGTQHEIVKKEKKEFYAFRGNKFTSYTGEESQPDEDDGIEHN